MLIFLKKIVSLSSIQNINDNAFEDCSMLEKVIFQSDSSLKCNSCCIFLPLLFFEWNYYSIFN